MNAERSLKKLRSLFLLALVSAFTANARSEIVLSVTPDENAPQQKKSGITVPKPKDEAAAKPAPKDTSDILKFLNNDVLHGTLLSIDEKTGVRWKNPEAKDAIEFKIASISQIKLASRGAPPQQHQFSVRLANDDELLGDVAS